tara:strand:+ start:956 stop:1510 length:555 start_codon:yes stop_codon:yes gene_type:complete
MNIKTYLLNTFFLCLFNLSFCQSYEVNQDAIDYYNSFSNNEHWLGKDECKLTYKKYSETFFYYEKSISFNRYDKEQSEKNPYSFREYEVSFSIDDILSISSVIHYKDSSKMVDNNSIEFGIEFKSEIEINKFSITKGDLPDDEIIKSKYWRLCVNKTPTKKEIETLQKAIEDIFPGIKYTPITQ